MNNFKKSKLSFRKIQIEFQKIQNEFQKNSEDFMNCQFPLILKIFQTRIPLTPSSPFPYFHVPRTARASSRSKIRKTLPLWAPKSGVSVDHNSDEVSKDESTKAV